MRVWGFVKKSLNGLHKGGSARSKANPLGFIGIQSRGLSDSNVFNGDEEDTVLPVLIVGAGPVGLVLAILLTKLGIFSDPYIFSLPSSLDAEKAGSFGGFIVF
jgi:hypothetical protein